MLQEVIVVEGKSDVAAINRAVQADCLITGGFTLSARMIANLHAAYKKRGLIILTDPDDAGEGIRRRLAKMFPKAKHAYVPREDAADSADGHIGIEAAAPEAIRAALAKVHAPLFEPTENFRAADLFQAGLSGTPDAARRRARMGKILGVGFANSKVFLRRLNHFGITREEFFAALAKLPAANDAGGRL